MRYDWAGAEDGRAERVGSVLRFDRVLKVSHLGLDEGDESRVLNLLAVTFEKTDPPSGMVLLAFADGALVRLEVECLEAELVDIGPRRPACRMSRPRADQRRILLKRAAAELSWRSPSNCARPDFETRFRALLAAKREASVDVDAAVAAIIADVRARGDAALIEYTLRFDRVDLSRSGFRIAPGEIEAAVDACKRDALEALELAHERVLAYHRRQLPGDVSFVDHLGVQLGWRWRPIDAVGLYVPGGAASYPSSVIMNAAPAIVAGCRRLAMVVPTPDGRLNPLVLAAAKIAGVSEIYRVGGAQAIAALAYGIDSIAPVDKIVGPGNAYVAAAKRRVFGVVGIDMIAGPSEVVVLADSSADPALVAADLLAQAEHDEAAQSILVTDDAALAAAVAAAVEAQLADLPRAAIAGASWRDNGAIILVPELNAAPALIDRIAPEHLEIIARDAEALSAAIAQRRRDLPRPAYARSDRRLCRRLEPRAADLALGALFLRPRRLRLRQAHLDPQMRRAIAGDARTRRGDARRSRRPHRPCALGRACGWRATAAHERRDPARSAIGSPKSRSTKRRFRAATRERDHERAAAAFDLIDDNHFAVPRTRRRTVQSPYRRQRVAPQLRRAHRFGRAGRRILGVDDAVPPADQGLLPNLRELFLGDPPRRRAARSPRSIAPAPPCTTRAPRCSSSAWRTRWRSTIRRRAVCSPWSPHCSGGRDRRLSRAAAERPRRVHSRQYAAGRPAADARVATSSGRRSDRAVDQDRGRAARLRSAAAVLGLRLGGRSGAGALDRRPSADKSPAAAPSTSPPARASSRSPPRAPGRAGSRRARSIRSP